MKIYAVSISRDDVWETIHLLGRIRPETMNVCLLEEKLTHLVTYANWKFDPPSRSHRTMIPIRLLEKSGGRSGRWQAKEKKRGRKG